MTSYIDQEALEVFEQVWNQKIAPDFISDLTRYITGHFDERTKLTIYFPENLFQELRTENILFVSSIIEKFLNEKFSFKVRLTESSSKFRFEIDKSTLFDTKHILKFFETRITIHCLRVFLKTKDTKLSFDSNKVQIEYIEKFIKAAMSETIELEDQMNFNGFIFKVSKAETNFIFENISAFFAKFDPNYNYEPIKMIIFKQIRLGDSR